MDTMGIITTIVTSLFGAGGIGAAVLFYRENRALKVHEVTHKYTEEWRELFVQEQEKRERVEGKLEKQYDKVEVLRDQLAATKETNTHLEFCKCTVQGCRRRQPPHFYDQDGNEIQMNKPA